MEVSRSQLSCLLPCMPDLVRSSRFVAIDLEMTGISFGDVGSSSSLVRAQEAYSQAKKVTETFGIVQEGLIFIPEYSTKAFNIPVFSELAVKHGEMDLGVFDFEGYSIRKEFNKDFDAVKCEESVQQNRAIFVGLSIRTCQFPVYVTASGFGYEELRGRESTPGPATDQQAKRGHATRPDTIMTGKLFLKLACRLFSGNEHTKLNSENLYSPSSSRSSAQDGTAGTSAGSRDAKKPLNSLLDGDDISPAELRDLQLKHPGLVAAPSIKLELESMPGETYPPQEVHIPPLWTHHLWPVYGNKMRVRGAGVISLV
ncbi:hypothetical protein DL771_004660 [Monosporascus sp. 5C6A]|nr:hypothetical protein DL771_004660 [Monosporascus sp. 5C6A]